MNSLQLLIGFILTLAISSCQAQGNKEIQPENTSTVKKIEQQNLEQYDVAYFASGCFWCVEAIYESVPGVIEAVSGYSGGTSNQVNYAISNYGNTGNAEALAVYYDSNKVTFKDLVDVYFASQDPSQKNGQGPDCGVQYRSILFYQTPEEQKLIKRKVKEVEQQGVAVAAEIRPFEFFVVAEDYHQDYKKRNPNNPYIKNVSDKRFKKFKENYPLQD